MLYLVYSDDVLMLCVHGASTQVRFQQQISELEQRLDAVVLVLGGSDSAVHILDNTAQSNNCKLCIAHNKPVNLYMHISTVNCVKDSMVVKK